MVTRKDNLGVLERDEATLRGALNGVSIAILEDLAYVRGGELIVVKEERLLSVIPVEPYLVRVGRRNPVERGVTCMGSASLACAGGTVVYADADGDVLSST